MKEELKDFETILEKTKDILNKLIVAQEDKLKILISNPEEKVSIAKAINELNKGKKKKK
jgi:hypothetical protein